MRPKYTLLWFLVALGAGHTIHAESLTPLEKAWQESRCTEFFPLKGIEAQLLYKKCSHTHGRTLRKCTKKNNRGKIFDDVLEKFYIFRQWKCFSTISSFYSDPSKNNSSRSTKVKESKNHNITQRDSKPGTSPDKVDIGTDSSSSLNDTNLRKMLTMEELQGLVLELEERVNHLKKQIEYMKSQ